MEIQSSRLRLLHISWESRYSLALHFTARDTHTYYVMSLKVQKLHHDICAGQPYLVLYFLTKRYSIDEGLIKSLSSEFVL